ncbi:MAG TPA: Hsp20/alpha crystallin family protein, partial [Firmicutes bacterium]|nr:Hsp20/alpha crystallin family protein [Bacillota bacterium]
QRKDANEERSEDYIRRERSVSQVCRTFIVENLDADQIQAKFENGLLRLTMPKPQELQPKVKEIHIK